MYNIAEDTGLGKGWERMIFNTGSALLDAIVLAVVSREPEGTYGYKITQEVRQAIDLSESTKRRLPGSLRYGIRRQEPAVLSDYGARKRAAFAV